MNKIPQYNQQSKPEVKEIRIYQKHGKCKWPSQHLPCISENKYPVVSMPERIPSNNI